MAIANDTGAVDTMVPAAEECKFITRIYPQGKHYPAEIRRMCKQGWKVVSIQEQRVPMRLDRLRAESPGALTQVAPQELVVYYMRCSVPSENRVRRIAMRFRGGHRHQA